MDGRSEEVFAILRPTSPFRSAETIRRAFDRLVELGDAADSIRAVEPAGSIPGRCGRSTATCSSRCCRSPRARRRSTRGSTTRSRPSRSRTRASRSPGRACSGAAADDLRDAGHPVLHRGGRGSRSTTRATSSWPSARSSAARLRSRVSRSPLASSGTRRAAARPPARRRRGLRSRSCCATTTRAAPSGVRAMCSAASTRPSRGWRGSRASPRSGPRPATSASGWPTGAARCDLVTILREPVARTLSHYAFLAGSSRPAA